jgi:hypothetical protein
MCSTLIFGPLKLRLVDLKSAPRKFSTIMLALEKLYFKYDEPNIMS